MEKEKNIKNNYIIQVFAAIKIIQKNKNLKNGRKHFMDGQIQAA